MYTILPLLDEAVYFCHIHNKFRKMSLQLKYGLLGRESVQFCRNSEA